MKGNFKMKRIGLTRKERERLQRKKLILDSALELFSEKGYHNVSIQEIAQKAEFAVGTLYKFFKNKEELYSTILREKTDEHMQILSSILLKKADVMTILKEHIEASAKFIAENFTMVRIYLLEIRGLSFNWKSGFDQEIIEFKRKISELLSRVLQRGIKEGLFRSFESDVMVLHLHGVFDAFLFDWIDHPEKYPNNLDTQLIIDLVSKGILKNEKD